MSEPISLTVAKFTGSLSNRGGVNVGANDISVLDVRELQRRMREAGPNFRNVFLRDIKSIGRPLESKIKASINSVTPLSGFLADRGRLGWNSGVAADKVTTQFKTSMGGRSLTTTLLRIKVWSPAVIITDMAGRSGASIGKGRRNDNATPTARRRNANINKGEAFISSLNREIGGRASRIVYPAAESSLPALQAETSRVLDDAMRRYNMRGI
jgi:hypothetical protein